MAYSPTVGGDFDTSFPLQFPNAEVSSASLATTPIELMANDGSEQIISHGTGFFWKHLAQTFLISAWHVFTGQNPFDGSLLSSKGFIPLRYRFYPAVEVTPDRWARATCIFTRVSPNAADWLRDPQFDHLRTDIAALPVPHHHRIMCLNDEPFAEYLLTVVGSECVILGYPQGRIGGLMTPIWRRGVLASEPSLSIDSKPMFLIDAATSTGFSGGPVLRRHIGSAPTRSEGAVGMSFSSQGVMTQFVGVYGGRLEHNHYGGEVPYAFYANRIPLILSQPYERPMPKA